MQFGWLVNWSDVVVAERLVWPSAAEEQTALLLGICPTEWCGISASKVERVFQLGYHPLRDYDLETRFGRRCFTVWTAPTPFGADRALIIREPKEINAAPLVVSCLLAASGGRLEASFHLLSGRLFGKQTFETDADVEEDVIFAELEEAAREEALKQELLESHFQRMRLVLHGFGSALPGPVPVWQGGPVTPQALEEQLAHLQALTPSELDALAAGPMSGEESDWESCCSSSREEDIVLGPFFETSEP